MTLAALLLSAACASSPATLRVDWFHAGDRAQELFTLDAQVREPLPWPGNPARPLDDTGLGGWLFEVRDAATGALLYSRGYATLFSEWVTTDEAKARARTFHESARFPDPGRPYRLLVRQRTASGELSTRWEVALDPASPQVRSALPPPPARPFPLQKSGPPPEKVDLLLLGDGYTAREAGRFERDARRLLEALFAHAPFSTRRADFNAWALLLPAPPPGGISRPSSGLQRHSPLGTTYDAFGAERYILSFDNRALRDAAAHVPYEFVVVVANAETYGGGGVFNLYSTVAARSAWSGYLFVHEFGHAFAGLADEYFTADPLYAVDPARPEPWERNVTTRPQAPKWRAVLDAKAPLPTPWDRAGHEARARGYQESRRKIRAEGRPEREMDALFLAQRAAEETALQGEPWAGRVGAFEGAHYNPAGYYRAEVDCVMFSRNRVPFCSACRAALDDVMDLYARPAPAGRRPGAQRRSRAARSDRAGRERPRDGTGTPPAGR